LCGSWPGKSHGAPPNRPVSQRQGGSWPPARNHGTNVRAPSRPIIICRTAENCQQILTRFQRAPRVAGHLARNDDHLKFAPLKNYVFYLSSRNLPCFAQAIGLVSRSRFRTGEAGIVGAALFGHTAGGFDFQEFASTSPSAFQLLGRASPRSRGALTRIIGGPASTLGRTKAAAQISVPGGAAMWANVSGGRTPRVSRSGSVRLVYGARGLFSPRWNPAASTLGLLRSYRSPSPQSTTSWRLGARPRATGVEWTPDPWVSATGRRMTYSSRFRRWKQDGSAKGAPDH
jgi:hypothetical protein